MKLVRTSHPNPKWTMAYLSEVMYKEGSKKSMMACKAEWVRDKEELIELLNLPQLGNYEWKDEARKLLDEIEKKEVSEPSSFSFLWGEQNFLPPPPPIELTIKGIYGRLDGGSMEKYGLMKRERYLQTPVGEPKEEGYEVTIFTQNRGLMWEKFWHSDDDKVNGGKIHGDRAILFQAIEHYELLANDPKFATCFIIDDSNGKNNDNPDGKHDYMTTPTFGEQIIIEGCNSSQIAIGDVFEVEGGKSKLVIEVSAPRKPGDYVDINHHGKSMGENGIKQHCLTYALAGWFTKVVFPGELREGMKLVRTKHPNPKWTLSYISNALYGEGDTAQWNESKEELVEMINLSQLGDFQWKDEGKKVLKEMETRNVNIEGNDDDKSSLRSGFLSRFIEFSTGASICYCEGIESLVGCGAGTKYYYD
jgi:MOSC domain-containing protein YiiM